MKQRRRARNFAADVTGARLVTGARRIHWGIAMLDDSVLAGSVKDATPESIRLKSDPICGNCGSPLSKHFDEDEVYCNEITNGDVFSDTPSDARLVEFMHTQWSGMYERLVAVWKFKNGHDIK